VPLSGSADLDAAVAAARAALRPWRAVSTIARARKLFDLRERLVARQEDLARSVTTEMGKTLVDARAEVARMIEMVECACAVPTTMQGRVLEDVSRNIDAETIRQPVGVCAAIVPFNFPAMVPFWFLPFAIACGNTFVLKPSEQVPLTQQIAFEELDALGLPPGVVNLVNGGREVVEGILAHPGIDAVSFVGSAPVAKIVYEGAAKTGKRVQALGGAKNHMVVMPDAVSTRRSNGIIGSAFGAAGPALHGRVGRRDRRRGARRLMPALVGRPSKLSVGDGSTRRSTSAPSCRARRATASPAGSTARVEDGATLAVDGREPGVGPEGSSFVGPTILDERRARRADRAGGGLRAGAHGRAGRLARRRDRDRQRSRFGNGTSIFTENAAAVRRYRHDVEAGMIGVNIGVAAPVAFFPFSGWKDSFLGDLHAHGPDAVEFSRARRPSPAASSRAARARELLRRELSRDAGVPDRRQRVRRSNARACSASATARRDRAGARRGRPRRRRGGERAASPTHGPTRSSTARSSTTRAAVHAPPRGVGRYVGDAQPRATGVPVVLVSTDWVFDGTQAGARDGRAAEPDQRVRLPEGGERAGRRRARRGGADRRRAGRALGAPQTRAARTPASATWPPRSSTACAPAALHGVGGPGAELGRHAHAGQRRRRA
jgi:malonate-semialdehyde dehydrogenase (acetylating)/methylmalonate-semialdehyde dehydrogenase